MFASQKCYSSVRSHMGLNETFNCNSLSHTIFAIRAFEVLHLENESEFKENNQILYFIRKKFLPLRFVISVLDLTGALVIFNRMTCLI